MSILGRSPVPRALQIEHFLGAFHKQQQQDNVQYRVKSRLPVTVSTFVLVSLRGSLLAIAHWLTSEIAVVSELYKISTLS